MGKRSKVLMAYICDDITGNSFNLKLRGGGTKPHRHHILTEKGGDAKPHLRHVLVIKTGGNKLHLPYWHNGEGYNIPSF